MDINFTETIDNPEEELQKIQDFIRELESLPADEACLENLTERWRCSTAALETRQAGKMRDRGALNPALK